MNIVLISVIFFPGFRAHRIARPDTNPQDIPDDPHPDPHDEEDFNLPDQQALIDAFLAGLAKESNTDYHGLSKLLETLPDPNPTQVEALSVREAREKDLIPKASDETLREFSYSEMKLYKHAISYKWTVDELIATIKLIKSTDFKVEDVNVDLHKRVAATIAQGHFTSHNMRESDLDGDQDLTLWIRSLEEVLREIIGDKQMAADGQGQASRRGSHVYEINTWLWNFGRPQPRVGGLSVAKTERIRRQARSETSRRAWETRKARKCTSEGV